MTEAEKRYGKLTPQEALEKLKIDVNTGIVRKRVNINSKREVIWETQQIC